MSGAPSYSSQPYPYKNIHGYLRQIFEAFGPERSFWGTDITRVPCSYRQCMTMFTEEHGADAMAPPPESQRRAGAPGQRRRTSNKAMTRGTKGQATRSAPPFEPGLLHGDGPCGQPGDRQVAPLASESGARAALG